MNIKVYHLVRNILIQLIMQGVANRGCSIRVGRDTEKNGKGESQSQSIPEN
jgi:hypothetical protein